MNTSSSNQIGEFYTTANSSQTQFFNSGVRVLVRLTTNLVQGAFILILDMSTIQLLLYQVLDFNMLEYHQVNALNMKLLSQHTM